jgi:undecaprenyl pyrophosphate phosphatase UppP
MTIAILCFPRGVLVIHEASFSCDGAHRSRRTDAHVVARTSRFTRVAHPDVELLFGNPYLIAAGLGSVGVMIILSGMTVSRGQRALGLPGAAWVGAVQGLCLPFRGFSRSGATISTGLFLGLDKQRVEEFSFALVVVLTPAVVLKEGYRFLKSAAGDASCRVLLPTRLAELAGHNS